MGERGLRPGLGDLLAHTDSAADAGDLPNPQLTPGDADPSMSVSDICRIANTSVRRNVSATEKAQVFEEYGLAGNQRATVKTMILAAARSII
jgi:hypothetical protein